MGDIMADNPKEVFEGMNTKLTANPESVAGMNCIYQFDITGDDGGKWFVDLMGDMPDIAAGVKDDANCTITMAGQDLVDITSGKLNGQMAFMTGKLKIAGDMGLAMKLTKILG